MNILIKGMEMPKPGRYEATIIVLDKSTAEIAISPVEDDIGYWKEYPLIPVPPHGDLIDRDAIRAEIKKHATPSDAWVFSFIRTAPTIIPAEEGTQKEEG